MIKIGTDLLFDSFEQPVQHRDIHESKSPRPKKIRGLAVLVADDIDQRKDGETASERFEQMQRTFGDPLAALLGQTFVGHKHTGTGQIDEQQIEQEPV